MAKVKQVVDSTPYNCNRLNLSASIIAEQFSRACIQTCTLRGSDEVEREAGKLARVSGVEWGLPPVFSLALLRMDVI